MKHFCIFIIFLFVSGTTFNSCNLISGMPDKPNILWITSEDMNAFIGAYGDVLANTPNLDRLASEGAIYTHAYATAPVCSPSRSCLITGIYATSLGTQHLRSTVNIPEVVTPFPKYLRKAGYYCSNNGKEDYNFIDSTIWNESSSSAHWRDRKDGQPFFSVFNITTTHQSQIFGSDATFEEKYGQYIDSTLRQDPDSITLPPYHYDTPVVRKLWARYYDLVTLMDQRVGEILKELKDDNLLENTIIFYYADHGTGMPRSKRSLYDSGLRVPLIIKAPEKWSNQLGITPGSQNEEMISFVDFAPTILDLCNITIPEQMQGISFLGKNKDKQEFVFGHADRVDEAYELSRTLRSHTYRYVRNFLPHLPLIQDNFFTDQSEIMIELRRAKELGNMTSAQATMWLPRRTVEELYDTRSDPDEVNNLALDPDFLYVLKEFRKEMRSVLLKTYDTGLMHEIDMTELAEKSTIYKASRDTDQFPLQKILDVTDDQLSDSWSEIDVYDLLDHPHTVVKFWALTMLESKQWQLPNTRIHLVKLLKDKAASVRIATCRAILSQEENSEASDILIKELDNENLQVRLTAARAIEQFIDQRNFDLNSVQKHFRENCPQEDWNFYFDLYTCWALESALKK